MTTPPTDSLHRRQFLAAASIVTASRSGWLQAATLGNSPEGRPPVVDTHLHCFAGAKHPKFPYHKAAPYRPADEASPEFLLKRMAGADVDYAIVVHPEPYQDDHRYLEHCLKVGKEKLKGTCLFFAGTDRLEQKMQALAATVPIVAARIHAYAPERLPPFGNKELRELWKIASDLGLAVQLHFEPRYAPGFEPYIKEFSQTKVLIDHLGRPFQGTEKEHAVVVNWAKYPNTIMKLSSIPLETSYPHRNPAQVVRQLAEAYGPDRLLYGGGFNAQATDQSYRAVRLRIGEILKDWKEADLAKIYGKNAVKLFGFKGE